MAQVEISEIGLRDDMIVKAAFARLDMVALSIAAGVLFGLAVFLATIWLLLKGAPPGIHVGPHLGLMANFLPGYSVSWSGSIVGAIYGFVSGILTGVFFSLIWNLAHYVYLMFLAGRGYQSASEV